MRQRTSVRLEADTALDILEVRRHALDVGPAPFKQRGPGKRAWTVSALIDPLEGWIANPPLLSRSA